MAGVDELVIIVLSRYTWIIANLSIYWVRRIDTCKVNSEWTPDLPPSLPVLPKEKGYLILLKLCTLLLVQKLLLLC